MTVFIIQEPLRRNSETGLIESRVNLSPAKPYGEFVYLAAWRALESFAYDPVIEEMEDKLADFRDVDYLLPVGNPILIGAATAIAAANNAGRVNMLSWDRKERTYVVVPLRLDDFEKGNEDDTQARGEARG